MLGPSQGLLWLWFGWLWCGLCLEAYGVWVRPQPWDTLSETTLVLFRAETTPGYLALLGLMTFLLAWYPNHVRKLGKDGRLGKPTE